jgi:DNA polymerase I-like protein with 3'-5' exonuclease and polymerase domains
LEKAIQTDFVVLDVENYYYNTEKDCDLPPMPAGQDREEWIARWDDYCYAIGFQAPGLPTLVWSELTERHASRGYMGQFLRRLVSSVPIVAHNSAHDVRIITLNWGIQFDEFLRVEDSMLLHNVLWSELPHTLNFCSSLYSTQNRHKQLGTHSVKYLQGDVWTTAEVWHNLKFEVSRDPQSWRIYDEFQRPILKLTHEAHIKGIRLDQNYMRMLATKLERTCEQAQEVADKFVQEFTRKEKRNRTTGALIYEAVEADPERTINMNSPKQVNQWLFDYCGLKIKGMRKSPKSGMYPTGKDVIAALQDQFVPREDNDTLEGRIEEGGHPLVEAKGAFTQNNKFLTSYIRPYLGKERCYPQFKLHGQATGRWSTTGPNIPGMNGLLKPMIIPDVDEVWVGGDWSNAELRIMAEISDDELLKRGFAEGWDLHSMHCAQAFGWDSPKGRVDWALYKGKIKGSWNDWKDREFVRNGWWGRVDPGGDHGWKEVKVPEDFPWEQWVLEGGPQPGWAGDKDLFRRFCKILVFRLMYGGSTKSAGDIPGAVSLGLPKNRLVQASKDLILAHPCWQEYWDEYGKQAIELGIVRNWEGRARRLMSTRDANRFREGVNFPIQSTVSDLLNRTLKRVKERAPWAILKFTIHDSFYFGCHVSKRKELEVIVQETAEEPLRANGFFIPFDGEVIGYDEDNKKRWYEKVAA